MYNLLFLVRGAKMLRVKISKMYGIFYIHVLYDD